MPLCGSVGLLNIQWFCDSLLKIHIDIQMKIYAFFFFRKNEKKNQQRACTRSVERCSHFKNVYWSFKPNAFPLLQTEPYSMALYHRAIICTKIQLFNRKENELVIICSEWQQSIFDFEHAQHNEFLVRLNCIIW